MGAAQDDPLGVRKDFPALRDYTFLNTAYTGLISQAVVDAAREWTATRAGRTYTVGEMLAKTDEARKLYAGMIGAGEDEIAFLSSTSEGENIVVNSLDFKSGDNVVYDDLVYPSTPAIYQRLADTKGVEIVSSRAGTAPFPVEEFAEAGRPQDAADLGGVGQPQQRVSPRHEGARPPGSWARRVSLQRCGAVHRQRPG